MKVRGEAIGLFRVGHSFSVLVFWGFCLLFGLVVCGIKDWGGGWFMIGNWKGKWNPAEKMHEVSHDKTGCSNMVNI